VKQNSNIKFAASHSMPAPDVFVLTQELWRKACERDEYVTDPPALVVEVISPANRKARVREKIALYLDHGVPEVWEVLPKKKVILVHRSVHGAPVEFSGSDMLLLPRPLTGELVAEAMFSINGI
jgi:Uma2 family endonuclease